MDSDSFRRGGALLALPLAGRPLQLVRARAAMAVVASFGRERRFDEPHARVTPSASAHGAPPRDAGARRFEWRSSVSPVFYLFAAVRPV